MSKKIMVKFPSYCYIALEPELLQAFVSAPIYGYNYEHKFFHIEPTELEIRVVDDKQIFEMSEASALEILKDKA